ncbi:hypothetical protein HG431_001065 [Candidatus Saccharibacteria bacterium]|jgi:hypothetical protein|nr:hypothetical protein [Candidatus Saccharibacteria bacterium]
MEDNLYPRSTEYFVPNADMDEQREKAKKEENAAVAKELNKLQQIIDRWNERIDYYKSLDAIPNEAVTDKQLSTYMLAHKEVVRILREERSALESIIDPI